MNILLIFFALPIATIIISIALQKILKCPPLVASITFAIFLIVTFIINNINFLVATIIYTILSYITAVIVCIISKCLCNLENSSRNSCIRRNNIFRERCNNRENNSNDLLTISSSCGDFNDGTLLTISSNCNGNNNDNNDNNNNCNCQNGCCYYDNTTNPNGIRARINVIPNNCNNGRTGNISGCYRRR
mgnify:FL=1